MYKRAISNDIAKIILYKIIDIIQKETVYYITIKYQKKQISLKYKLQKL